MGGFIYDVTTTEDGSAFDVEVARFNEFPKGVIVDGENKNVEIKAYLTDKDGNCLPLYKWMDDDDQWSSQVIEKTENAFGDEGDGHVYYYGSEQVSEAIVVDGALLIITLNQDYEYEYQMNDQGLAEEAISDGAFQGVGYDELLVALSEAEKNHLDGQEPANICGGMVHSEPLQGGQTFASTNIPQAGRSG